MPLLNCSPLCPRRTSQGLVLAQLRIQGYASAVLSPVLLRPCCSLNSLASALPPTALPPLCHTWLCLSPSELVFAQLRPRGARRSFASAFRSDSVAVPVPDLPLPCNSTRNFAAAFSCPAAAYLRSAKPSPFSALLHPCGSLSSYASALPPTALPQPCASELSCRPSKLVSAQLRSRFPLPCSAYLRSA